MAVTSRDEQLLRRALTLARSGRRYASPNPAVGCVITRGGVIISEAVHRRAGEPHAERLALAAATSSVANADVYVTLEPCSHHGRTPPCVDALIDARVGRVVIAAADPAAWVRGEGIKRLRAAAITVDVLATNDPLAVAARREHAAHRVSVTLGRPLVTYKAAVTLDGHTATGSGDARWISSSESRALVHESVSYTHLTLPTIYSV